MLYIVSLPHYQSKTQIRSTLISEEATGKCHKCEIETFCTQCQNHGNPCVGSSAIYVLTMTIRRKRRWVLEIIIGNQTNAVHLWTQITYPCEGRQVKHFWCSHFKTNIQTDNIHTYKEFVDSDLNVPMLHRNCKKKKKWERPAKLRWPSEATNCRLQEAIQLKQRHHADPGTRYPRTSVISIQPSTEPMRGLKSWEELGGDTWVAWPKWMSLTRLPIENKMHTPNCSSNVEMVMSRCWVFWKVKNALASSPNPFPAGPLAKGSSWKKTSIPVGLSACRLRATATTLQ